MPTVEYRAKLGRIPSNTIAVPSLEDAFARAKAGIADGWHVTIDGKSPEDIEAEKAANRIAHDKRALAAQVAAQLEAEKPEREEAEKLVREGLAKLMAVLGRKAAVKRALPVFSEGLLNRVMKHGVCPATMARIRTLRDAIPQALRDAEERKLVERHSRPAEPPPGQG